MSSKFKQEVIVEFITNPEDFEEGFECLIESFGKQAGDALFDSLYPDWDTDIGKTQGIKFLTTRWENSNPNKLFLKATVTDPNDGNKRVVAGLAIWEVLSMIEGHGEPPKPSELSEFKNLNKEIEKRYVCQVLNSLRKRRFDLVREKVTANPPAIIVLDLCAVHRDFQGRGIGKKLVQWGLDEAMRRGGLEAVTEASVMGREVYKRMGFQNLGEIVYEVDEEFRNRTRPSNTFMRTGRIQPQL